MRVFCLDISDGAVCWTATRSGRSDGNADFRRFVTMSVGSHCKISEVVCLYSSEKTTLSKVQTISVLCMLRAHVSRLGVLRPGAPSVLFAAGMIGSPGDGGAEVLDDATHPAQVLQRMDRVMCLFLRDLTAGSLPLLALVRRSWRFICFS